LGPVSSVAGVGALPQADSERARPAAVRLRMVLLDKGYLLGTKQR
jgi:hypothetical protein